MRYPAAAGSGMRHAALFYRTPAEFEGALTDWVRSGAAAGEPVLVAVPAVSLPRRNLLPSGPGVTVADMAKIGANPARIITVLRAFADRHPGRRVRYCGEPAWPERSALELQEVARHEALLNVAFAGADVSMLCLYDEAALPRSVMSDACSTHPQLLKDGDEVANADYADPVEYVAGLGKPLLAPADAIALTYDHDLRPVRALVASFAQETGLPPERCTDLVIAASEVAANTLRHTGGPGVIRLWSTDTELLCQVDDIGFITDPLAGQWRHSRDLLGGQGLWLVNQVCDVAEIRTTPAGTAIRLHMYLNSTG